MSPWFKSSVVSGPESKGFFFFIDIFVINLDKLFLKHLLYLIVWQSIMELVCWLFVTQESITVLTATNVCLAIEPSRLSQWVWHFGGVVVYNGIKVSNNGIWTQDSKIKTEPEPLNLTCWLSVWMESFVLFT